MFHGTERRSVHLQRLLPRCRQQRQGAAPAAETRGEAAKVCEAPGVMAKWWFSSDFPMVFDWLKMVQDEVK